MGIFRGVMKPQILLTFLAVMIVTPALAQDLSPVTTMLDTVGTFLTGPFARSLGLIAIAAAGVLFMLGRMHWLFAGSVIIGIVIVLGAATILGGF